MAKKQPTDKGGKATLPATPSPVQPKHIFRLASSYEYSAGLLLQTSGMIAVRQTGMARPQPGPLGCADLGALPPTMVPSLVLDALAIELYLKCLLQLESGKPRPPRGHPLVDLFSDVSEGRQAAIKKSFEDDRHEMAQTELAFYEKFGNLKAFDFDHLLTVFSQAFEKWRYCYELEMAGGSMAPTRISQAVRKVILAIHPEWQEVLNHPRIEIRIP